jgi:hypothetical protein
MRRRKEMAMSKIKWLIGLGVMITIIGALGYMWFSS